MIKIVKPGLVPAILATSGKTINAANLKQFKANAGNPMVFRNAIYGHTNVKSVLKKAQHGKCCFCEKEQDDEYGAVEHFRPKDGYKKSATDTMRKPGYFWLCYSWENLFFVCNVCNSGYKGNVFPLTDERKRANNPNKDIKLETTLLLDPAGSKDPRNHIHFNYQFPVGVTKFGKQTIKICGLDRDALNDKRLKLIHDLDLAIAILFNRNKYSQRKVKMAKDYLIKAQQPESSFSATAIDYLKSFKIV